MTESTKVAQRMKLGNGSLASLSTAHTESKKRKGSSALGDRYEGFTGYGIHQDENAPAGKRTSSAAAATRQSRTLDTNDEHPPAKKHKLPPTLPLEKNSLLRFITKTPLSDKSNTSSTDASQVVEARKVLQPLQEQTDKLQLTHEPTIISNGTSTKPRKEKPKDPVPCEQQELLPAKKTASKASKPDPTRENDAISPASLATSDTLDAGGMSGAPEVIRSALERFKYQPKRERSQAKEVNGHIPLELLEREDTSEKGAVVLKSDTMISCDDAEEKVSLDREPSKAKPNGESECIDRPRRRRLVRGSDMTPEKSKGASPSQLRPSKELTLASEKEQKSPARETEPESESGPEPEPVPDPHSASRKLMSNYFGIETLRKPGPTSTGSRFALEPEGMTDDSIELLNRLVPATRSKIKTYSGSRKIDTVSKTAKAKNPTRRRKTAYSDDSDGSESELGNNDSNETTNVDDKTDDGFDPTQRSIGTMLSKIPQAKPKSPVNTKKTKKVSPKKSSFSDSNDSGSDFNGSMSDDDLSDFTDTKADSKPDPNQRSITAMFSKAPLRTSSFISFTRTERKLSPHSQSLLSGGLSNLSNTCYLNSVLQALRNTNGCADALFAIQEKIQKLEQNQDSQIKVTEYQRSVFENALQVFRDLDMREGREGIDCPDERSVYPKEIINTLRQGNSLFNSSDQQDAAEFLFYIISHFDDVLKALMQLRQESDSGLTLDIKAHIPENWQPVNDLFQVGTLKVTHCQKCLSVTKHMDRSIDLTVQIDADNPTVTRDLHWGISETMKMEHLMGDNQRFCEKCNSKEDAHVYHYFTSLPKIMILRLQRYNFKEGAIKIQNGVSCAERMSFEKWMSQDYTGPHPTYELCAVIVHRGRVITSGHYYVYIKKTVEIETVVTESDGESRTEKKIFQWLKYNDSSVTPVSDNDMAKVFSGGAGAQAANHIGGVDNHDLDSKEFSTGELPPFISTFSIRCDLATPYVYIYRRMDEES